MRYLRNTKLGFAEDALQLDTLIRQKANGCGNLQIIAVTPEVDYLAAGSGEEYLNIEDFYYWKQIDSLGEDNYDIAEELCERIDVLLATVVGNIPGSELFTSRAFFHPIKGFLDSVTMRMFPVESVFKYVGPSSVVCFAQGKYEIKGANLLDKPSLSLTSRIVPLVAQATGCSIELMGEQERDIQQTSAGDIDIAETKGELDIKITQLRQAMRYYQPFGGNEISNRLLFSAKGLDSFTERIINHWGNYPQTAFVNIGMLCLGNSQINPQAVSAFIAETGSFIWKLLCEDAVIRKLLVVCGKDIYGLIKPLLNLLILKDLPRLLATAVFADANMKNLNNAVVMIGGMMDQNCIIARSCSKHSIPMVSTHRGGYLGYCYSPFHERYEMADADHYICGGPGATETFSEPAPGSRWRTGRKRAIPVTLGSAWLDDLAARYRSKKHAIENMNKKPHNRNQRTIMYVMSALLGDNCYIGHIFHPEIWLWRFQAEAISFMAKYPDIKVILKAPPLGRYPQITNPVFDWFKKQDFPNITIFPDDGYLEDIIDLADAFIIDSPSTTVWPLVCTEKPFIAYIDKTFFRLVPKAKELLGKRAILAETKDDFFAKLKAFLESPKWIMPKPVNDEFLCHYGTYLNDGNSDKRVAEFLFGLANQNTCYDSGDNHEQLSTNCSNACRH